MCKWGVGEVAVGGKSTRKIVLFKLEEFNKYIHPHLRAPKVPAETHKVEKVDKECNYT